MSQIIIRNEQSTEIFMDYFYGTRVFLHDSAIIFSGNGYTKDCVLMHISRRVFDGLSHGDIGYFQGKMKERGCTKKDIEFYSEMIRHYLDQK